LVDNRERKIKYGVGFKDREDVGRKKIACLAFGWVGDWAVRESEMKKERKRW